MISAISVATPGSSMDHIAAPASDYRMSIPRRASARHVRTVLSLLMAITAASAVTSCLARVDPEPPVMTIQVREAGTRYDLPDVPDEVPLCVRTDRICWTHDGGCVIYETPRPCNPLYNARHDWGDPPEGH